VFQKRQGRCLVPEQIPRSRYRDRYERKRATRLLIFPASNITEQPSDFRAAMQHILFAAAKNYFQTVMLHSLCHLASRALVRKIDTFEIVSLDVQRERAMLWWQRRMLIRVLANHVVAAPA
jgi:hypothetical protein